jgi:hypothetical protein
MATQSKVTVAGWIQFDDSTALSRVTPAGWQQSLIGSAPANTILLEPGSYDISGQAVTTLVTRLLGLDAGAYNVAGQNVNLIYAQPGVYIIPLDPGSYVITGSDALIDIGLNLESGSYSIGGQSVDFTIEVPEAYSITLDPGTYSWAGNSIALRWSGEPLNPIVVQKISVSVGARIG